MQAALDSGPRRNPKTKILAGKYLLALVLILLLSSCFFSTFLQALSATINFEIAYGVLLGLITAGFCATACFLAWAPLRPLVRASVIVILLLLSVCLCAIGISARYAWGSFRVSFMNWNDLVVFYAPLPLMLVFLSLPCWQLRYARGWQLKHVYVATNEVSRNDKRSRIVELVSGLVALLLSYMFLAALNGWSDLPPGSSTHAAGLLGPVMFLIGTVIVFPISRLLLCSDRYLVWSAILTCTGAVVVGPAVALAVFLADRPFKISPQSFFFTSEFMASAAFFTAFVFTVSTLAIAVRLMGYSLSIPLRSNIKTNQDRKLVPHPLD